MKNTIVVGSQWGDEGKAKVIDVLAEHADVVIRFQGGANAGHTVVVGEQEFVFHLIPSAIMRPSKTCVIGNGVVLDPGQLLHEIEELEGRGFSVHGRLWLAENMQIVMPWHKQLDQLKEAAAGLGATRWEVVRSLVLPYTRKGLIGGVILGLGRALGETMAVTFVIGNAHHLSASLFAPSGTIASTLANEFTEASDELHL
ncbi:MAG TPA: adenylosuccinate synthetase [Fibrobacteria bacterium]|nr:adenylosuccinate synthetase [Fibrobacteria bacterium]